VKLRPRRAEKRLIGVNFFDVTEQQECNNMKSVSNFSGISRRILLSTLTALPLLSGLRLTTAQAQLPAAPPPQGQLPADPLASWNEGPTKQAILDFVRATTDPASQSPS